MYLQSHDCSDALAERAIKLVCEYLPKAYADGDDIKQEKNAQRLLFSGG